MTLDVFESLLLYHLTKVYTGRKKTVRTNWTRYSDLLVDKFANHAGTLCHIIKGFIEVEKGENWKKVSTDVFSTYTLLRSLVETYATFNHIFVSPQTDDEKEFRFLIWQIEGLLSQEKFKIYPSDFEGAGDILSQNSKQLHSVKSKLEESSFFKKIGSAELAKIYNFEKSQAHWKFTYDSEKQTITRLNILQLVEVACPIKAYYNFYKYASMHTHAGFISVERYERIRGKVLPEGFFSPFINLGSYTTILLIKDLCTIDTNANSVFEAFDLKERDIINFVYGAIKKKSNTNDT